MQITKLQSNKFKTNLVALFITVPLTKENCTKNALLTSVLRRGTNNLKTQEEINFEEKNINDGIENLVKLREMLKKYKVIRVVK